MPGALLPRTMRLGKYRVLEHIAAGGMAAVYKAVDEETEQLVALKVLSPELAARENSRERFRQEAAMGLRLRHDNIVSILEHGEAQGSFYLAMEFIDGITLSDYIDRHGPLSPRKARLVVTQVAAALDYAHQLGIVHRDVKPANIMLTRLDGKIVAKLTDLGLSREQRDEAFRLTREGHTVGTVDYMSPEQARDSRAADIRSDLYSLGCTLFHMLTGQAPFPEGTLVERLLQHADAQPADPRTLRPDIPEDLAIICLRLLAKDPQQRPQTPAELLADLSGQRQPQLDQNAAATVVMRSVPGSLSERGAAVELAHPPESAAGATARALADYALPSLELPEDPSPTTSDQRRLAQGQIEFAKKLLKARDVQAGLKALRRACQLDPTNIAYREFLRGLVDSAGEHGASRLRWAWPYALMHRAMFRVANWTKKPWQLLDYGEQILVNEPGDLAIHLEMAWAAEMMTCRRLAWWLLRQARQLAPNEPEVHRALARFLGHLDEFAAAIHFWERVERAAPDDREPGLQIKALAARETISRGRLAERVGDLHAHIDQLP